MPVTDKEHASDNKNPQQPLSMADKEQASNIMDLNQQLHVTDKEQASNIKDLNQQLHVTDKEQASNIKDLNQQLHVTDKEQASNIKDLNQQLHITDKEQASNINDRNQQLHVTDKEQDSNIKDLNQQLRATDKEQASSIKDRNQQTPETEKEHVSDTKDLKQQLTVTDTKGASDIKDLNQQVTQTDKDHDAKKNNLDQGPGMTDKEHAGDIGGLKNQTHVTRDGYANNRIDPMQQLPKTNEEHASDVNTRLPVASKENTRHDSDTEGLEQQLQTNIKEHASYSKDLKQEMPVADKNSPESLGTGISTTTTLEDLILLEKIRKMIHFLAANRPEARAHAVKFPAASGISSPAATLGHLKPSAVFSEPPQNRVNIDPKPKRKTGPEPSSGKSSLTDSQWVKSFPNKLDPRPNDEDYNPDYLQSDNNHRRHFILLPPSNWNDHPQSTKPHRVVQPKEIALAGQREATSSTPAIVRSRVISLPLPHPVKPPPVAESLLESLTGSGNASETWIFHSRTAPGKQDTVQNDGDNSTFQQSLHLLGNHLGKL